MSLGRLVPWISWEEWDDVGTLLYDESKENNRKGIEIVSAWRIRGRVPVGVESTALIREVMHSCVYFLVDRGYICEIHCRIFTFSINLDFVL